MKLFKVLISGLFVFSVSGCTLIYLHQMMKGMNCKLEINEKFISNSCGLINGVRIEKLDSVYLGDNGTPVDFRVKLRTECYNPGMEGKQTYWPDKIEFKKINGHYRWQIDTVDLHYLITGGYRHSVWDDSLDHTFKIKMLNDTVPRIVHADMDAVFMNGPSGYEICPIDFEKDTWYFLNFFDQHFATVLLYVNADMKFKLYTTSTGLSPI